MTDDPAAQRRRQRRRPPAAVAHPPASSMRPTVEQPPAGESMEEVAELAAIESASAIGDSAVPRPRDRRVDATERALRGLVTTRASQLSWSAATRARAVAMPTAEDLALAEQELVIIRRNYTPPEPLRTARTVPDVAGRLRRSGGRNRPGSGQPSGTATAPTPDIGG